MREPTITLWDVIHPGRKWALKCNGTPKKGSTILAAINKHLKILTVKQ